jgi:uncharacterized membrane protein
MATQDALRRPNILVRCWRLLCGAAVGVGVLIAALHALARPGLSTLMGWNSASAIYLAATLWIIWRDDEARVRRRAADEDEGQSVTSAIVLSAVVASLAATVIALNEAKGAAAHAPTEPPWA